jgi:hypothetical protein
MEMVEISEELKEILDVEEESDKKIVSELEKLESQKDSVFLSLIAPYVGIKISPSREASASMGISEEFGVETAIESIREKTQCRNLILLINSPGGLVQSSYKVARALRKNFDKITVFMPHIAASGGTLISLVGDEIVMGMMSQLSPIDPTSDGKSALSVVRGFSNVMENFKDLSEDDAPYPLKVLAEKHSADDLDMAISGLKMMEMYAKELLELGSINKDSAEKISKKLVNGFITHSQVINLDKAKELGLNISIHSKYKEEWKILRSWLAKYLLKSADKHIIRYYISNECKIEKGGKENEQRSK